MGARESVVPPPFSPEPARVIFGVVFLFSPSFLFESRHLSSFLFDITQVAFVIANRSGIWVASHVNLAGSFQSRT